MDNVGIFSSILSPQEIEDRYNLNYSPNAENILANWKFNSGSGNLVFDHSGNLNHGEIFGATWSEDVAPDPEYLINTIAQSVNGVTGTYAADIDGDGDLDAVSSSYDDSRILWHENNGGDLFVEHVVSTNGSSPRSVHTADVDGDGDMDIISASFIGDKISWHNNDGNQNFSEEIVSTNTNGATFVRAVDIDQDGDVDILSTSLYDNKLSLFKNDGSQNFSQINISESAEGPRHLHVDDIDQNGTLDVLTAGVYDNRNKVLLFFQNSNGSWSQLTLNNDQNIGTIGVGSGDIDGDGDIDVFSASSDDHKIRLYENDGSENFTTQIFADVFGVGKIDVADLDHDGDMDVLYLTGGDNQIGYFKNDGNQNFNKEVIITNFITPSSAHVIDFDNDGDLDILASSKGNDKLSIFENTLDPVLGCMDIYAGNFNQDATIDDGSCEGYPNQENYALSFDGQNDYVSIPGELVNGLTNSMTINAWIYPNDITSNRYYEIIRQEQNSGRILLSFQDFGSILSFGIDGSPYYELDVNILPEDYENQWVFISATVEGNMLRLFRNGDQIGEVQINESPIFSNQYPISIGATINTNGVIDEYFNGLIDELSIWPIAMDENGLKDVMYEDTFFLDALAHFKFNAGDGNILFDHSGNSKSWSN